VRNGNARSTPASPRCMGYDTLRPQRDTRGDPQPTMGRHTMRGLRGRLVGKSIEAYVLALETINCLSIKYRVETFLYLLCNAWELLLKAKIIADSGTNRSIWYRKRRGEPRRSLTLRDCLKRVVSNQTHPVRRNVEMTADLRDQACHLVISKVPKGILGLLQASVLNYHAALNDWFGLSLSERVSVGMMTIVYDFRPEEFDFNNPRLRREMGQETAEYLLEYQADVQEEFEKLGKPAEFSVGIDYHLVITKKPGVGDISLTSGPGGAQTRIVEVPKDPGMTHPYRQKDVIDAVNSRIAPRSINAHDLLCVRRVHEIDKRPEFYYWSRVQGSPKQYSQGYVDWLVRQHERDPEFFKHARNRCKE
jgi:hypothetical protein